MLSRRSLITGNLAASVPPAPEQTLVVVFQRFAADWINLLVPHGDPDYRRLRPTIAITNPIDLDGFYGLHPALAPLQDIWTAGDLAFVAATGWLDPAYRDRSHFHAQALAETVPAGRARGGWVARTMIEDPYAEGIWAALAAESSAPDSLQGFARAIALTDFASYTHGSVAGDAATQLLLDLAAVAGEPAGPIARLATSMRDIEQNPPPVSAVTYPATTLGRGLQTAAQAINGGLAPRIVTVSSTDDWDTHVSQVTRHQASVPAFAQALRAFHDDLGERLGDVTLVVMTEFGRKAIDNGGGTDHGTGSSMLVMGGAVNGGRVLGTWPGLTDDVLVDGEDLLPTTDFRAVLGELAAAHVGGDDTTLERIFPGGYAAAANWTGLLT